MMKANNDRQTEDPKLLKEKTETKENRNNEQIKGNKGVDTSENGAGKERQGDEGHDDKGKNARSRAIIDGDEEGKVKILEAPKNSENTRIVDELPDVTDMQEVSLYTKKNKMLVSEILDYQLSEQATVMMPEPNYIVRHMDEFPASSTMRIEMLDFSVEEEIWNYVGYESDQVALDGHVRVKAQVEEMIVSETWKVFQRGTRTVRHVLTTELRKRADVNYYKGIPIVEENEDVFERNEFVNPDVNSANDKVISKGQYIIGAIKVLQRIMMDDRVAKNGITMVTTRDERLGNQYSSMILDEYTIEQSNANIALANLIDMRMKWLTRAIRDGVFGEDRNESKYVYGKSDEQVAAEINGKLYYYYAVNYDMYIARILNFNFHELRETSKNSNKLQAQLLASALKLTKYTMPSFSSFIAIPQMDEQHLSRILMANLIIDRSLPSLFNELNVRYLMESGALMMSQEFNLRPKELMSDLNASSLNQAINHMIKRYELGSIYEVFAREMGVTNSIYYLFNDMNKASYSSNESILILMQLILFSQFFPRLTAEVKGEIATMILHFLFAQFPEEYNRFVTRYGIKYRIVDGQSEFLVGNEREWLQAEDQLSVWHPSVFAPRIAGNFPILTEIRELMIPRGTLTRDERAISAGYPRESREPYHYIPFQSGADKTINSLEKFASLFETKVKRIITSMKETKQTLRNATSTVLKRYVEHVSSELKRVSPLYVSHVGVILEALSNQAYNFMPNYNGNIGSWKQKQYCITDEDQSPMLLYSTGQAEEKQYNIIRTDIVWSLIFGVDGPVLRNAGVGTDGIVQSLKLSAPDGEAAAVRSRELLRSLNSQLRSMGLILELQGESLVRTNRHKIEGGESEVSLIEYGEFQIMLEEYTDSYLRVDIETTVQEIENALDNGILLFVIEIDTTPQIRNMLLNDPTVYLTTSTQTNAMAEELQTNDTRISGMRRTEMKPLGDILMEMEVNDYSRELAKFRSKMPNLKGKTMKKILGVLLKQNKNAHSDRELAKYYLNYTRGISTKLNFKNPQIRRATMDGMPIMFDQNTDNPHYESSGNFLNKTDRERLLVGMKMMNNKRFEPLKGLRIVRANMRHMTPDQTYDVPEGLRVVEYNDEEELFGKQEVSGLKPKIAFADEEGNLSSDPEKWQRIRLVIRHRTLIADIDIEGILSGIEYAGWIVDMPDREYVFNINYADDEYKGENVRKYFEYDNDRILDVTFLDTTTYRSGTTLDTPTMGIGRRYVFPMEDPTWVFIAMNLMEYGGNMPVNARLPAAEHYSTGKMDYDGTLRYDDGTEKLEKEEISMTNKIYKLSSNVITKLDAKIKVKNPTSLEAISY
ncbi:Cypovirus VP1 [Hubei lepidoptera virus 3]|uniref:Cypovirus VP1 n=1 Tax=Hubei lepidoptera virus 3 TaxID=1922905 RepID=UPI00090B906A|nr:Cypovirus VP1 [Hubei lepidoptera virus 3]APG79094.1 Cypovirus VP1 [Hubei lepidoptera virus 3]